MSGDSWRYHALSASDSDIFEMARISVSQPSSDDFYALDLLDPAEYAAKEKRLVRKIDLRLMPCLILMIVLNYLDRNALANARVQGIEKSLNMHGDQFNTAISVLFAGYIVMQVPSNAILVRTRPSIYLVGHLCRTASYPDGHIAYMYGRLGSSIRSYCRGPKLYGLGPRPVLSRFR